MYVGRDEKIFVDEINLIFIARSFLIWINFFLHGYATKFNACQQN